MRDRDRANRTTLSATGPCRISSTVPNTFSTFQGAHNLSIHEATVNNVQGNYIVNHLGLKDERREFLDFHSRLSQNFNHEPYYASRHKQNLSKTAEGTCQWVFENPVFLGWREGVAIENPVLWVHGPPGSGKSILCSQVIQDLERAPAKPTLAYHFCDFARQHKEVEILSMLACQLLDVDTLTFSDIPPLPISIISAAALQLRKPEYVRNVIKHLVVRSPSPIVHFLLDGLDEELAPSTRWSEGVGSVLQFLIQIAAELPHHVRVWVSSQRRVEVKAELAKHSEIDVSPHARRDIVLFLSKSVPQMKGPGKQDQDKILDHLEEGAETSFIWATLMVDELKKLPSLSAIKDFVRDGFPSSLNEYYARIFDGFPRHLRPLASQVFSLVVYAKRPLRFCELWDALWALSSNGRTVFNLDDKPYEEHLTDVFQPFIELVPTTSDNPTAEGNNPRGQHICRLIHSTVRDFFFSHCMVLCPNPSDNDRVYVCPELPFTACLTFLSQSRFSTLLNKENGDWIDSSGVPVMEGRFLIYAAKYWDKHLDSLTDRERQTVLLPRVVSFVTSPNFWTVIQVQSIWVQYQFSKMSVTSKGERLPSHLRRVFPLWFMHSDDGFKLWVQYRSFLRHWRYLLCLGERDDESSEQGLIRASYVGELHHIWTRALGEDHFLRERQSSVTSFPISNDGPRRRREQPGTCIYFTDLINQTGESMHTLQIYLTDLPMNTDDPPTLESVMSLATLECRIEAWKLDGGAGPTLQKSQTLRLAASTFDLDLYITNPTNPYVRCDRAALASFASDGQVLRIGSRIFTKNETGSFHPVTGIYAGATSRKLRYIEEVACHGSLLIIASRTKISGRDLDAKLDCIHEDSDSDGLDVASDDDDYADADHIVCLNSDEEGGYSIEDDDSDMECASEDDSISEGSSDFSDEDRFQDVLVDPGSDAQYYYSDDSEDEDRSYAGGTTRYWRAAPGGDLVVDSDSESSDSEEEKDTKKASGSANNTREEDEDEWNDLPRYFGNSSPCHSKPRATLAIWSTGSAPVRVFKKEVPIRYKVYHSPPAFHPTQPLVVWPVGEGDILFVDYRAKRSFTLALRPSTTLVPSRFVTIQCVFSPCGQYVHIAALEGFRPDPRALAKAKQGDTPLPPLILALLLATYRLSAKKTMRSSPKLIHVVRVNLKEVKGIDTKQIPFRFTWTREYLYLTASWKALQVCQVHLFRAEGTKAHKEKELDDDEYEEDSQPVLEPEKTVFLPNTCKYRSVQFFPAPPAGDTDPESIGHRPTLKLVVGYDASVLAVPVSKPRTAHSCDTLQLLGIEAFRPTLLFEDPIVCYLDDKDLGEWVDSKTRAKITRGSGSGQLYKRMDGAEMFNPEDDCDLEPYYF